VIATTTIEPRTGETNVNPTNPNPLDATRQEWNRILERQLAALPNARAFAESAREHAEAGRWLEAASYYRRAAYPVRHLPIGIEWRQESRFADAMAREEVEDIAFDRGELRRRFGLPA
jgi:hypothetical protein